MYDEVMRTHYIPRWILKHFLAPAEPNKNRVIHTLELNQPDQNRGIRPSPVFRAASGEDLWPADIESNIMGPPDNEAAKVFRSHIEGKRQRINLPHAEQMAFATWLGIQMPRVPASARHIKQLVEGANNDPSFRVEFLYEHRVQVLSLVQTKNPKLYEEVIAEYGRETAEAAILLGLAQRAVDGTLNMVPDAATTYHTHLRNADVRGYAAVMLQYQWQWLWSDHGFVIGDNPLVRWNAKLQRWDYGLRRTGTEVTMPLTPNLCLMLQRPSRRYDGELIHCSARMTRRLNMRQRFAAEQNVYAANPALLEPLARPVFPPPTPL